MHPHQQSQELYSICDDVLDPAGTGQRGKSVGMEFTQTTIGKPVILDRASGRFLTCDVYDMGAAGLMVNLYCPRCSTPEKPHSLSIKAERKRIDFDAHAPGKYRNVHGVIPPGILNVEPFSCTWEYEGESAKFGIGACNWRVAIENNVAKEA